MWACLLSRLTEVFSILGCWGNVASVLKTPFSSNIPVFLILDMHVWNSSLCVGMLPWAYYGYNEPKGAKCWFWFYCIAIILQNPSNPQSLEAVIAVATHNARIFHSFLAGVAHAISSFKRQKIFFMWTISL